MLYSLKIVFSPKTVTVQPQIDESLTAISEIIEIKSQAVLNLYIHFIEIKCCG